MKAKHQNIDNKIGKIPKNLQLEPSSRSIKTPPKNKNPLNKVFKPKNTHQKIIKTYESLKGNLKPVRTKGKTLQLDFLTNDDVGTPESKRMKSYRNDEDEHDEDDEEYQHELYTRGKVNLLKQYTELDVKLLLLPPTVFQQIKKSNEWDFVDDFDNLDSDIAEDDEVRLHTPVVDQTSNEIELLNYENSTVDDEGNTWIDSSFQIEEVVLKDKKVLVHLNKYQKLKEKFFIKRSIYDLMIYSQYSAQRIHKYCETTQWISKINKCSSEQNDVNFLKGTPNIFPKYGSKSKNIWQPKKDDQDRFLELSFDQAVYLTKISIYETLNPGSVSKIYSWNDQESNFILIYDKIDSNESEIDDLQNSRIFQPPLKKTKFKTNIIRIEFLKNDKTIQVDSVNIQGIVEKSNLNRFSIHSEFIDTIEQQKHVIHVPYTNPVISPFDYNQQYNYLIFNEIESQKYHTTKKLTNVSLNSKELGKIQFRAKYLNDEILKIKIISNFAYVLIKQIKIPGAYVLNVWDLSTGTLEKTFEFKECSGYDNIVNWEITNDVICCFRENEIFVYDISSNEVEQWKHRSKIQLDNNVNHISIKEECNLTLNILSVCTSNSELIIWDIFLCKILHQIKLPEPGTCSSILSFGSLIAEQMSITYTNSV
eukprot:gene8658-605_t